MYGDRNASVWRRACGHGQGNTSMKNSAIIIMNNNSNKKGTNIIVVEHIVHSGNIEYSIDGCDFDRLVSINIIIPIYT